MKTEQYLISGMSCAACSAAVNRVVAKLDGVKDCDVNLITGKMTVCFDEATVGKEDFFRVVKKAGFGIEELISKEKPKKEEEKAEPVLPFLISLFSSGLLLYISMGQMLFKNIPIPLFLSIEENPYNFALTQLLLCLPALFLGKNFFLKGIPLLFKGRPNMDTLIAIGAGSSFVYSIIMTYCIAFNPHAVHNLYFESVAVVITLVMLGKFLERKSRKKTTAAITSLIELSGDTATVLRGDKEFSLPVDEIDVGEKLVIKPGAAIPLDGIIVKGESSCDESMLTGESLPVQKNIGDKVIGGSVNIDGLLIVEVTHIGQDTVLSKIIKFVEDAQSKKAPISKVADKVAGIFVPAVMLIAFVSSIIWFIVYKDIAFSLKIFTSVLVIACPCALGLATPTAIMVGTGLGASKGILIRNGEVLETTHKIKVAVFDKTGTVTEGKMSVCDVISDNQDLTLKIAACAESGSEHPIAKAIINFANEKNINFSSPENFKNISGKGIEAICENKNILVGKEEFLKEKNIDTSSFSKIATNLAFEGKSIIFVSVDNNLIGIIALSDKLKSTSKEAFEKLKNMGIKTVLLSGDNKPCAEYIGKLLAADEIYSEVLPEEKAMIIKDIRAKYGDVMMIGDGINDTPALTEANVGCAIGSGSDIAALTADLILMNSNPLDVIKAINLSRFTIKNIKQNLFWAFCYNLICIPIAAGLLFPFSGYLLNPMLAGLAMSLSSVFVVGNALRLKTKKI